ncbi:MAG: glutamate 5-kinase [Actinomyces sp.]|jgi:glutamate 5-kinase|uniref:glutamate 5-kinase n=1 Tax=Actinomycetaceae TaxID=2049 RepID=UPI0003974BDB|nr:MULTISPECIES: glutamate 5-kinase [Actinomycetaceae]ERH20936.1 glutamate 5-kinase [Actinomyces sp. oral taxon 172 str. F0311]MBF0959043.1 glutamate 5-kinase [Actinomyces sp.]WLD77294.1 glutamate 5-kinase [Schaalia sp. HMT-172]
MSGVSGASRIVVKIGSSSLTRADGGLDLNRIDAVARLVSRWRGRDREVIIVSSGAVAAGLDPLGFSAKPKDLPSVQAAAAMGQGLLMARWTAAFQAHHLDAAQVLLTTDDVMRRDHYTNVRASLTRLLGLGVVPILNENDAVTTRELRFGDNDRLAALIAQMIKADALVLLTDVDGLYTAPPDHPGSQLIERVTGVDDLMSVLVTGAGSRVGTGGMATKVQAAMLATASGIGVQLASANDLQAVLEGTHVGTWFEPRAQRPASRRLWIAHVAPSRGEIIVDEGAARAITEGKKSLLIAGVHSVLGHFEAGDVVDVASPTGLIARGVSGYDSDTLAEVAGAGMEQLAAAGFEHPRPAIHRDDLAVLGDAFSAMGAD